MVKSLERAAVLENIAIAKGICSITLSAPKTAASLQPGQFIHLRLPNNDSEILRLPFSVFDCIPELGVIVLLYQVLGKGTEQMSKLQMGDVCDLIGPLGQGWFPPEDSKRALLVGGGLGAAPLHLLAKSLCSKGVIVDSVLGAGSFDRIICREELQACGSLAIATDDGSEGFHGFCTEISASLLAQNHYDYVATCGPEAMQRIIATQCGDAGIYCQLSMERLMACGVGACLSCVMPTHSGLKRVCKDGPVFEAQEVIWSAR